MKIAISTDTSCLLNDFSIKKYPIFVLPLNVIVDGEEYLDGVTINQEQLLLDMTSNKSIKTSTPPLGSIVEYFENIINPENKKQTIYNEDTLRLLKEANSNGQFDALINAIFHEIFHEK